MSLSIETSVANSINTFLATSTIEQVQAEIAKRLNRKTDLWDKLDQFNKQKEFNNCDKSAQDPIQVAQAEDWADQIINIGAWLEYVQGCYDKELWEDVVMKGVCVDG